MAGSGKVERNSMTVKALLDTNILVYAYDRSEPQKHQGAIHLISQCLGSHEGAVSTQILSEFFVTVTRKIAKPLDRTDAFEEVRLLAQSAPVLELRSDTILKAIKQGMPQGLSFWDALIWSTAHDHAISTVYSEDFQHGRVIESVRFVNPFLEQV